MSEATPPALPRPFEQQLPLEKTLRAHLYKPTSAHQRAVEDLGKHVRRKEYNDAARCQEIIRRTQLEIQMWNDLLALYESEFAGRLVK